MRTLPVVALVATLMLATTSSATGAPNHGAAARKHAGKGRTTHTGHSKGHKHAKGKGHHGRGRGKGKGNTPQGVLSPVDQSSFPPPPNPIASLSTPCADADTTPTATNLPAVQASVLCLVNQERAKQGLGALNDNATLDQVAVSHTQDMITRDYFAHVSPDGRDSSARILASGYANPHGSYLTGENLGYGNGTLASPSQIVQAWMNSPEHRANILNKDFRDSGLGLVYALPQSIGHGLAGVTFTQDFGTRP